MTNQPTLTPSQDLEVAALYRGGLPRAAIAEHFGLGVATIVSSMRRTGTKARSRTRFTDEEQNEIVQRYCDGESAPSIARALGRSHQGIYALLGRRGISIRSRTRKTRPDEEAEIARLYRSGWSQYALGREFALSTSHIGALLAEQQVPMRRNETRSPVEPGIYLIEVVECGGRVVGGYVGQSVHLSLREADHRAALRRGRHENLALQQHHDLLADQGHDPISWRVLERFEREMDPDGLRDCLVAAERRLIGTFKTQTRLFNSADATRSCWGSQVSLSSTEESKIVEQYESGVSSPSIARSFRIDKTTVLGVLRRQGVQIRDRSMAQRKVSPEVEDQIAERYLSGATMQKIAGDVGLSRSAVSRVLQRKGAPIRAAGVPRIESRDAAEIAALYCEGATVAGLADRYGKAQSTIRKAIRSQGLKLSNGRALSDEEEAVLVKAYIAGATLCSVATDFGVSQSVTKGALRRAGLEPRTLSEGRLRNEDWGRNYALLTTWYEANDQHPRKSANHSEARLARWVSENRRTYKQGRMRAERVQRLEAISGWVWCARR